MGAFRRSMVMAVAVAAVLAPYAARSVRAQVLADRIPADAMVYMSWAGSDAVGGAYDASHLRGFLEALELPQFIAARVRQAMDRQTDPQQKEQAKFVQDLLTSVARSPTAVYLGPIDFANGRPTAIRFAVASKLGKDAATGMAGKITAALQAAGNPPAGNPQMQ